MIDETGRLNALQVVQGPYIVPAGIARVLNHIEVSGNINVDAGASLTINGNCSVSGDIVMAAGAILIVNGNCWMNDLTNDSGGSVTIHGDCYISGNLGNNNAGSVFLI
jgi:formylmethanofuran dehydrogenase subunit C